LAVPLFLNTIEESSLSVWLRETPSIFGYYFVLVFHSFGMVLIVGLNAILDLRLLGVAPGIPLAPLEGWFKWMWVGFWINAVSGVFLLISYPTKAFTNWDFYLKLTLIAVALWVMQKLKHAVFGDISLDEAAMAVKGKSLAIWSLVLWTGVITAGRLLAYTYIYITYGER
jgi:hypothetical protein